MCKTNSRGFLFLVVGKSGSGKSYLTNYMCSKAKQDILKDFYTEDKRFVSVQSYTTRKPRHPKEIGHVFVNQEEFDSLVPELVSYTRFNGYEYGVTANQLNTSDFFVVDTKGIFELMKHQNKINKNIHIIFIDSGWTTRLYRMIKRGDGWKKALSRLFHDRRAFNDDIHTLSGLDNISFVSNHWYDNVFDIKSTERFQITILDVLSKARRHEFKTKTVKFNC